MCQFAVYERPDSLRRNTTEIFEPSENLAGHKIYFG
jgi:hypothetical protein